MSIRLMTQVWDHGPKNQSELLVLLALADFADDDGNCWPSMASIAKKARLTGRGAQKIVRRLEESGYVETVIGGGRHGCNQYRITPNGVPPERCSPRTAVQETPNGGSPEPSRTIIKKEERAMRLPEQWEPTPEGFHFGLSEGLSAQDVWREADKFRDYWNARSGSAGRKLNWDSTWRNWIRKAVDDRKPRSKKPADDPTLRAIARAAGAFEASPVDWPPGRGFA